VLLAVSLAVLTSIAVRADDKPDTQKKAATVPAQKTAPKKATAPQKSAEKQVLVTGSLIPRTVKRQGGIVDTPQNVYVLDREEMQRYGAATTADALRRLPGVRVSGR